MDFGSIIPAAGLGTRMLPLSASCPKELLPMGDRTLMQWTLHEAKLANAHKVSVVTSPAKDFGPLIQPDQGMRSLLDQRGGKAGNELLQLLQSLQIEFCDQPDPLGLGHAVLQAQPIAAHDWNFVQLPDEWYPDADCLPLLAQSVDQALAKGHQPAAAIAVMEVPLQDVSRYGIADIDNSTDEYFHARGLVEKPPQDEAPSRWAIIGRYLLHRDIFDVLQQTPPGRGGEIQLTDALDQLAKQERLICVPYKGIRIDTGSVKLYNQAWQWYLEHLHS